MPRLSTQRYLQIHRQLKHTWHTNSGQSSELTSRDQLTLHRYFQTTNDETDNSLTTPKERVVMR
ncbi:MAG TPA: hypothetical protein VK497_04040 [Candidatus Saccharimonadales bacterium]|nr:hypothetical protein [Candidatus Saccharimonadales bacterium]